MSDLANDRSYALSLAKRYFYERNVTLETLVDIFSETTDPLIGRLIDLAVHEPARTGAFITVSQRDYEKNYWPNVADVLEQLERGEVGVLPDIRPWSKTRIFWISVLMVFVGASAAEHGVKFWRHITGTATLSAWSSAGNLFGALLMGLLFLSVSTSLFQAVRHRIRSRRDA